MKKILLTICMAFIAITMSAQLADKVAGTYIGDLDVFFVSQFPTSKNISIEIEKAGDASINFYLKNFLLGAGDDIMPVGNVTLSNIELMQVDDSVKFATTQTITLTEGDLEEYVGSWIGPSLGELPVSISGTIVGDSAIIEPITIPLGVLGTVSVTFKGKNPNYTSIKNANIQKVTLASSSVAEQISLLGIEGNLRYAIYDVAGSLVKQGNTEGIINIASLHKGVYLLKVGKMVLKFVKK